MFQKHSDLRWIVGCPTLGITHNTCFLSQLAANAEVKMECLSPPLSKQRFLFFYTFYVNI